MSCQSHILRLLQRLRLQEDETTLSDRADLGEVGMGCLQSDVEDDGELGKLVEVWD